MPRVRAQCRSLRHDRQGSPGRADHKAGPGAVGGGMPRARASNGLLTKLSGEVRLSPAARTGPLRQDLHARLSLLLGRLDSLRGCERPRHVVQGSRRTWRDIGWRHSECPSGACDCRWLRPRRGHRKALGEVNTPPSAPSGTCCRPARHIASWAATTSPVETTNDARIDSSNSSNS